MKIAILSDVHGNFDAFSAVLANPEFLECEVRVNLGDCVGYYFEPRKVLEAISKYNFISVRGNHEVFLEKSLDNKEFLDSISSKYGLGLQECLNTVPLDEIQKITSWPVTLKIETTSGTLLAAHGSLESESDYLYPDSDLSKFALTVPEGTKWLCLGNTHWPMIRYVNGITILNPGSIGQPRNGLNNAHWLILDIKQNSVKFMQTPYDTSRIVDKTRKMQPDMPKLWEVFTK